MEQKAVSLHPLHIGEIEDGVAEVGRPDTGVFVSLPEPGIAIIRDIQEGYSLAQVSERFAHKYGEPPDLDDFLGALTECGFVRSEADTGAEAGSAPRVRGWHLLAGLPTHRVAWLVSRPALWCWVAVWVAVPVMLIIEPRLVPVPADGRLGLGVALDAVLLTVLAWSLIFVHEIAHLLAVRARGCTGALRLSHRLHLLAAETDMSGVRALPRSARYAPYLAGMTFNLTVLGIAAGLQWAGVHAQPIPAIGFLCAVTLLLEFAFFMRTDVYYVIVTWLRLGNLMTDTWRWVANQISRALRRPARHDLSSVPAREMRVVRLYAAVLVVGVGVFVGQFLLFGLPLLLSFVRDALAQIAAGPATGGFWDAIVLLAFAVAHFGTLGTVALLKRIRPVVTQGPSANTAAA